MAKALPTSSNSVLRQMDERGIFAPEEFDAWLAARRWAWQRLDRGDYGISTEEALVLFVFEDPVRWCETFLVEPDTGAPWRFFDYQKASIRAFDQDVVHQDGAEVGKTREIVCLVLWGECTSMGGTLLRPWMLIGAPQQTHLDEIILAVEEQVGAHEDGSATGRLLSQFWLKPKRTPHVMHRFRTLPLGDEPPGVGRVYYRPAAHDGEAFRGVHVNAQAIMDEAAKLKTAKQWSEFSRALKPGCRRRAYSVPDGDRTTEFFRMSQQAVQNLPAGAAGERLFRWPKSIMPAPFWSTERDEQLARLFGGRQTPGYKRNVLGEWGEAESPVWSWDLLLPCVAALPDYRIVKLTVDNPRGEMVVEVIAVELVIEAGKKSSREMHLFDGAVDLEPFLSRNDAERRQAMRALLRSHLDGASRGVYWAGCDLGESNDPTEIVLSEQVGPKLRDVLRVRATGMAYYLQRELLYCLDELFGQLPHYGVDLGNAGTVVVKDLQTLEAYADARFDERLTGFQFSNAVDCIGEDGEGLRDPGDEDGDDLVRAPAKHWATQCITQRLQALGYALPYDADVLNSMTSHTARAGTKWPIYAKKDDHAIDARRQQMLRKLYDEDAGEVDHFSSGASLRAIA